MDRLLKKRQLNVQEQNAVTAHRQMKTASFWRDAGVPDALARFGESQGIGWSEPSYLILRSTFQEYHAFMA